ncbi:protein jim lovell isoform X2 [Chironomus tepperi]|uniref:protein jim lovell isoform X2 n=1 Tax=Chironomus tepperi TaxID=113505 RepID=UPI00391F0180
MSTSAQENYSLRWNNHQSHILESFDALLQQNSLVDVTLVCADRSLRAHKVVLSACSPFFERVFKDTPCKHPVIVLKDFKGWLVQAIVDFMYRGEISVPQERLSQLIQAGESLQVRGLIGAVPYAIPTTGCASITELITERENSCISPMPRRKQARPRRRSGDLTGDLQPQDLNDDEDAELHEIAKRVRQNGIGLSINEPKDNGRGNDENCEDLENDDEDDVSISNNNNNNNNINNSSSNKSNSKLNNGMDDEDDEDDDDDIKIPDGEEKENQPDGDVSMQTSDVPENLCTKKSPSSASDSIVNDKNNNNDGNGSKKRTHSMPQAHDFHERFILSLKDLRHLSRYRQGPPGHPFNDILSHLPISPPPSFQMSQNDRHDNKDNNMKIESDHSDAETPPFPDQLDLQHSNYQQHEKNVRENHQKLAAHMMSQHNSNMSQFHPPPFQQGDGPSLRGHGHPQGHPSQSPMSFPSVSALTLTPPHMFGLDSPLGLFPPGMDPSKMYNPLMDLPDHHPAHRQLHPDHQPFLKKKLQRPKGQHSAPRGGPPRSWTNAELTEALQHVWNKKMTTSQASRIFGIPYNSLLMYVRGKYGKSLKLEQLRKDCISGPPIEMLQMTPGAPGEKKKEKGDDGRDDDMPRRNSDGQPGSQHGGPRRSASSDPDLMNPLFNPFPGGFYPDFPGAAGFPGLQLSMLNLLPPDARLHQPMMPMVIDDDCKSDTGSVQSLDDSLPSTPLNLNREKNGSAQSEPSLSRQMFPN